MNNKETIMKVRNTDYLEWQNKIQQLEEENTELKKTIEGFRKGYADLNDYSDTLKSQLSNIKTLNRDEIKEIFAKVYNYYFGESEGIKTSESMTEEEGVTAICNLAYDKNKITAILVGKILESDKDAAKIADEIIKAIGGK